MHKEIQTLFRVSKTEEYLSVSKTEMETLRNWLIFATHGRDQSFYKHQVIRENEMKTQKTRKRLISLLLAVTMSATMQSIPVQAESSREQIREQDIFHVKAKTAVTLSNPRIVSDSDMVAGQKVTWDCVEFGYYPQAEIVSSEKAQSYNHLEKETLEEKDLIVDTDLYNTLQTLTEWDDNGDIVVGDDKFRRIKKSDATFTWAYGDDLSIKSSLSDQYRWFSNTDYHYFKYEPIKWRVLQVKENQALILADVILDDQCFNRNAQYSDMTWKISSIRSWLNGYDASFNTNKKDYKNKNFINCAFSSDQQTAIVENENADKLFLLSRAEAYGNNATTYGFVSSRYTQDEGRRCKSSTYAKAMGLSIYRELDSNENKSFKGCSEWWLSSSKIGGASYIAFTALKGNIFDDEDFSSKWDYGVRPALKINLLSKQWDYAGTVCSSDVKNEGKNPEDEVINQSIIDRVSEYTSDELYSQFDNISNSDYSYETKYKLYQSLFQSYGITDVREGIHYLSNTTNKRHAYMALTTDDLYCASNFKYWLKNTAKGKAAQAVLLADGLIFNGEINDWLDFSTYLESDYPGVAKYKAMLYDFMDASSDSIEIASNIKLVSDMAGKATGAAKLKADNLIEQLNHCSTAAEAEKIMNSSAAMEVWVELAEVKDESGNFVKDNNGSIELTYKLDESSGFGQFSKAMGYVTKGVSIANMALSDVSDLLTLDSKLAIYTQYQKFLQDIVSDTDGLPFQMRWAAAIILTEMEEGYFAKIKDIAWEIINQTNINSTVLKQIIGKTTAGSLSSWINVIGIEAFFINEMADIGGMVKKESYVEGYADLSSAFTKKLERSKQAFLADKTEANAWDFYYNYNILFRLRYKGEEAYLSMTKIEGFLSCFSDFGYAEKEAVVNDTLQLLESKCQFTLDAAEPIPESCQFASKSVINCPVNVSVYAEDGTLIAELLDGVKSDITNTYGRFAVVHDSYSGDYAKVICLNSEENVSFKITGTDEGLVTMDFTQAKDEESKVYAFDSVPVDTNAVINTTIQEITEQNTYGVDMDGNGEIEEQGIITIKPEVYVPVASVDLSETALELKEGESSVLKVAVTPSNASKQKVLWMSADPSVAMVADGKVTAISEGSTIIYCMLLDNMDKTVSCEVTVSSGLECIHTWDKGKETKVPTCTQKGEIAYTCTVCGETKTEKIKATGHQNTEIRNEKEATCIVDGYTGDTYCKDCNTKIETGKVIATTGKHIWDKGKETKAPTCTQKGEITYTCTVCGETKTEKIKATGHQNTEIRNEKEATCIVDGYTGDTYCKDCNTKIETGKVIATTGKHIWDKGKETKAPTCTQKGKTTYTCTVCGQTKTDELAKTAHTYKSIVTKATTAENGNMKEECNGCGKVKNKKTIFAIKSAVLNAASYTYNDKAKKPSVTVRDSKRKIISKGNYTIAYKNNKKVGKATVTIKLKGNYKGTLIKTFQIVPKGTSVSGKITAKSQGFTVKWKKQKKSTAGYQVQYATSKKFAKKATVTKTIKKNTITRLTVKKLKPRKKYYVRVRTYQTVKGKNYCSGWSKSKEVKTKK